jgi:hypothetical protein
VTRSLSRLFAAAALTLCLAPAAFAQDDDDPAVLKPAEPDFTLGSLPTNLRLPVYKSAFRVTHRFLGPLDENGIGDLWGMDVGAQIGLEYRFGIIKNGQIGFYRTSDKTIDLFSQYSLTRQEHGALPLDISAAFAIEGTNNFQDSYSPSLGAIISRRFGDHGALYLTPTWVNNSNAEPQEFVDHNDTFIMGIGGRVRIRPTVYLMAEVTPRLSGYKPNTNQATFAIEKRAGGHMFQLNFSNGFATMPASLARGAYSNDHWYMGFNLTRKFF